MDRAEGFGLMLSMMALAGSIFCLVSTGNLSRRIAGANSPGGQASEAGEAAKPPATGALPASFLRDLRALLSEANQMSAAADVLRGKEKIDPATGKPVRHAPGSLHAVLADLVVKKQEEIRVEKITQGAEKTSKACFVTLTNLTTVLSLTDDQKSKAMEFINKQIERMKAIHLSGPPTEEAEAELLAIERETSAGFEALLTDEQKKLKKHIPRHWVQGYLHSARNQPR